MQSSKLFSAIHCYQINHFLNTSVPDRSSRTSYPTCERNLREKCEQVEIILKFDPKTDDANDVRDRLSLLKGNVTPERKPLGTYVRPSRRQPQAVPVAA